MGMRSYRARSPSKETARFLASMGYAICSFPSVRRIKLSGRELAVLKALGFTSAVPGEQIREHTQIQGEDLTDVLNALLAAGYVESKPYREQVSCTEMLETEFEVNPGYVHELKTSMQRSWM